MKKISIAFLILIILIICSCSKEPPSNDVIRTIIKDSYGLFDKGYHYGVKLGFGNIEELNSWIVFEGESGETRKKEEQAIWDWMKRKNYIKKGDYPLDEEYILTRQGRNLIDNSDTILRDDSYSPTVEVGGITLRQKVKIFYFLQEGEPEIIEIKRYGHNRYEVHYQQKLNRINCPYSNDLKSTIKPEEEGTKVEHSIKIKWRNDNWERTWS